MISTLKNFFNFCTKENRRLFYQTLVIGVLIAICEASNSLQSILLWMAFFQTACLAAEF